jgi:hypothetical protein
MITPEDPAQILTEAVRRKEEAKQASIDAAQRADEDLEAQRSAEGEER